MTYSSIRWDIVHLAEAPSTNRTLWDLAHAGQAAEGTVVVADSQTHGRGQGANLWESAPGANLTFSILLQPSFIKPSQQFVISQTAALAVRDFVASKLQNENSVAVKWPNDIYVNNGKIAGILIEHEIEGLHIKRTVIGIGLNVNQHSFVGDAPNPVSLLQLTGTTYSLSDSLQQLLSVFVDMYTLLQNEGFEAVNNRYLSYLYRFREWAWFRADGQAFEGFITGVEPQGHLIVRTREGLDRKFMFKKIEFL